VKALDSEGRSALQLAGLYCDCDTVQLLFDSGGWIETLAAACMLNVVIAGNTDTLALLLERGINCSNVIDDDSGYTLLHAAAAYGRLECAGMLIRHGFDATTLSTDGVSAVDIAFALDIPALFRRDDLEIEPWESCKATALLLLQNGCGYDVNKIASDNAVYAALITEHLDELRQRTTRQQQILQVYTTSAYSINSSNTSEYDNSSHLANGNSTLQIQLLHADSGVMSSKVYTLDTTLLAKLHAATARQSSSILLNMLVPTYCWGISNVNSSNTDMKLKSYDGEYHSQTHQSVITCCSFHESRVPSMYSQSHDLKVLT
jgi:Ankyrin repeats (many copies)